MITPSISFDDKQVTPIWAGLTMQDVQEMIRCDVAELDRLHQLQSEAAKIAGTSARQVEEIRLRSLISGWEHAQDAHWSWYKEILNADSRSANRSESLGAEPVGPGN